MLNTTRQNAIDITFVIILTGFHNPWNHRFHNVQAWQPLKMERNIRTHITVNHTNTHENWADSFYHSGNTGKSHKPYIWHLFSALFVSFCNIKKIKKNGHNRDNRMRCEHTFFLKQEEHQHVHQDLQAA